MFEQTNRNIHRHKWRLLQTNHHIVQMLDQAMPSLARDVVSKYYKPPTPASINSSDPSHVLTLNLRDLAPHNPINALPKLLR